MPIYAEKNMRYVHFAETCEKMRQYAKYAAITYSHKIGMPLPSLLQVGQL